MWNQWQPQSSVNFRRRRATTQAEPKSPYFQFGSEPIKETDEAPIATAKPLTLARSLRSLAPVSLAHNSAPLRRSTKWTTVEVEQRGSAFQTSTSAFTDLAEVVLRVGEDPVAAIEILDSNRHQRVLVPATHRYDGRLKPQKKPSRVTWAPFHTTAAQRASSKPGREDEISTIPWMNTPLKRFVFPQSLACELKRCGTMTRVHAQL